MGFVGTIEAEVTADTSGLEKAAQRSKAALGQMAGRSGLGAVQGGARQASITLTNFSRIVEDSAFGIRGVANNISPMIESFTRLAKESRSAGQSIAKNLLGALKGGGGLILLFSVATTVAITMGDKIAGAFGKAGAAARQAQKDFEEALGSILGSVDDLDTGTALGAVRAELTRLRSQQFLQTGQPTFTGFAPGSRGARLEQIESQLAARFKSSNDELRIRIELQRLGISLAEASNRKARERTKEIKATAAEIDRLLGKLREIGTVGSAGILFELQRPGLDSPGLPGARLRGAGSRPVLPDADNFATEASVVGAAIQAHLIDPSNTFITTMTSGIADIITGFKDLRDITKVVSGAVRGLIADLIEAGLRAAAIRLIGGALGVSTGGFGSLFLGALGFAGRQQGSAAGLNVSGTVVSRRRGTDEVARLDLARARGAR